MLSRVGRVLPVWLVLASGVGCSSELPSDRNAPGSKQHEIFGGTLDTVHDAVVYLTDANGANSCTGTIIARSGTLGVVLTSAHCTGMEYVIQAEDAAAAGTGTGDGGIFLVQDFLPDPQFSASQPELHAFALVSFTGADASTPIIPVLGPAEDTLAIGTNLEFVGYGVTENGSSDVRRRVTVPISDLNADYITVSLTGGAGPCSGDSGGPALFQVGGVQKVAGVNAVGDGSCTQFALSDRVSSVSGFIQNGITTLTEGATCETCSSDASAPSGPCGQLVDTCFNDGDCSAYADCLEACSTEQCRNDCAAAHPSGAPKYDAILTCQCNECATVCPSCNSPPDGGTDAGPVDSGTGGSEGDAALGGSGGTGGGSGGTSGSAGSGGKKSSAASSDDGGCGCRVGDGRSSTGWLWLAGLGFVALQARRRMTRR